MAIGPGKYDDLATYVRDKVDAEGVLLIVINGNRGPGFACQTSSRVWAKFPAMLRYMADQIEADFLNAGLPNARMPKK